MTVDQIDDLLQQWQQKMDVATGNILQLLDNPTYKDLVKRNRDGKLQGVTKDAVEPALGALDEMWSVFPLLSDVLDKARKARADLPRLFNSDELQAIEDLLTGSSITITTQIPFAQRDLLTPAETTSSMTPDRVLDLMVTSYKKARDVVNAIEQAQPGLISKLADAVREAEQLVALAGSLGESASPELGQVQKKVDELKQLVSADPLGCSDGFEQEIVPLLAPVRASLAKVKTHRDQVDKDMSTAAGLLTELEASHAAAKAAAVERKLKVSIDEAITEPLDDTVIDGTPQSLKPWLARLQGLLPTNWRSVSVGVANWLMQARTRLAQSRKAVEENNKPLEERRELRGRLDALKVKAASLGLGEDAELAKVAGAAREALFSRPTPLAKARELVAEYGRRLK